MKSRPIRDNFLSTRSPEDIARIEAITASPEYIEKRARTERILAGTASEEEMAKFNEYSKSRREWFDKFMRGEAGIE